MVSPCRQAGSVNARFALGLMYYKGEGVAQSNRNAYVCHTLAEMGGNKQAEKCRDEAAKRLSAADLSAAHGEALRRGSAVRRRLQSPFAVCRSGMRAGDWKWVSGDQDILWKWLQFLRHWRHLVVLVALVALVETPERRRGGLLNGARRIRAHRRGGMLRMLNGGPVRRNDKADSDGPRPGSFRLSRRSRTAFAPGGCACLPASPFGGRIPPRPGRIRAAHM